MAAVKRTEFDEVVSELQKLQSEVHTEMVPKIRSYDDLLKQKETLQQENAAWRAKVEEEFVKHNNEHAKTVEHLKWFHGQTEDSLQKANDKLTLLDSRNIGPMADTSERGEKSKWSLTRPKDMDPGVFSGKEEEWPRWKEALEDFCFFG